MITLTLPIRHRLSCTINRCPPTASKAEKEVQILLGEVKDWAYLYHQGCSINFFSGASSPMVKTMLVSRRLDEVKGASFKRPLHNGKLDKRTMGDGFYVLREPRSDRGIRRKPEKVKPEGTGKRGRPRSHEELRPMFAESLRERGLVATQKWLANGGIPVSLTLLNAVAEEYGIVFAKGRPRKASAA